MRPNRLNSLNKAGFLHRPSGGWTPAELYASGEKGDTWLFTPEWTGQTVQDADITSVTGMGNGLALASVDADVPTVNIVGGIYSANFNNVDRLAHTFASNIAQPGTVFIALKSTDTGLHFYISGNSSTTRWRMGVNSGNTVFWQAQLAPLTSVTAPVGSKIFLAEYNGASSKFRSNGVQTDTGDVGTNPMDSFHVGELASGTTGMIGEIYAVGIIDRILTADEIANLEAWMSEISGIAI